MLNQHSVMDCIAHVASCSLLILKGSLILSPSCLVCCKLLLTCTMGHTARSSRKNVNTKKKSSEQQVFSSMCFDPAKFNKMCDDVNARNVKLLPCSALNSSTEEFSMKTFELINSLKVDKLTHPSSSVNKSQWIDAFLQTIKRKRVVASIKPYLQKQKENMFDEMNPTISQVERESVQYAIEVLESFNIFKQTSNLSIAKATAKKLLNKCYSIDPLILILQSNFHLD